MYFDNHIHFTGSLSYKFIFNIINDQFPWCHQFETQLKFENFIAKEYGNSVAENYNTFFSKYELLQTILKTSKLNTQEFYYLGIKDIIFQNHELEIDYIEVIAGPKTTKEETLERIQGMVKGITDSVTLTPDVKFRLTFIRDQSGEIKNIPKEGDITYILDIVNDDLSLEKHLSGFDISGIESYTIENLKRVESIIRQIHEFNCYRLSRGKSRLDLSIHWGENFNVDNSHSLNAIDKILDMGITKVSHATLLWIKDYNFAEDVNKEFKLEILRKIARNNIEIEICPTANLFLTPLKQVSNINFSLLYDLGVKYSINSDNMTLFNTNLIKEIGLVSDWI